MKKNIIVTKVENKSDTTAAKLGNIIKAAFPLIRDTGKISDVGTIHPEPKSKGKAIIFTWRKSSFKMTEALKITELTFYNTYEITTLATEAQSIINGYFKPVVNQQVTETVPIETPVEVMA